MTKKMDQNRGFGAPGWPNLAISRGFWGPARTPVFRNLSKLGNGKRAHIKAVIAPCTLGAFVLLRFACVAAVTRLHASCLHVKAYPFHCGLFWHLPGRVYALTCSQIVAKTLITALLASRQSPTPPRGMSSSPHRVLLAFFLDSSAALGNFFIGATLLFLLLRPSWTRFSLPSVLPAFRRSKMKIF